MPVTRCLARHRALVTRNRKAPVVNLPMELLSEIFHVGLDEQDDQRVIEYLGTISSTCSAWRNAALGTPPLWQRIIYTDCGDDPKPKPKGPAIPRHTKDRLLAYLSRSKNCSIRLRLTFGANPLIMRAIRRILDPHLPRCLSISLSFRCEPDVEHFLPLPGNLCRLTEFTCTHETHRDERVEIRPMFAEPESVSLQKLILNIWPPVDSINTRNLEVVRLMQPWTQCPQAATLISRCHSLTTLIMADGLPSGTEPVTPFTLPNLIYLDTISSTVLTMVHTPNLQTLISRVLDSFVVQPASWPALTTLCCIYMRLNSATIRSLLGSSPRVERLILLTCSGTMQSLKPDGTTWLPALRLLQVFGDDGDVAGFDKRPTLRIEYGEECGSSCMDADELKAKVELGYDGEPGMFKLDGFGSRNGAAQQAVSVK